MDLLRAYELLGLNRWFQPQFYFIFKQSTMNYQNNLLYPSHMHCDFSVVVIVAQISCPADR